MRRGSHVVLLAAAQAEKPIEWRGSAYDNLCAFPEAARREAGFQLGLVQQGRHPDNWKPMPTVGRGAIEIRINAGGAFQVIFVATFDEAIYVLHAFEKRARKTPRHDVDLAKRRYRDVIAKRERR